jgi:hypothetical protein
MMFSPLFTLESVLSCRSQTEQKSACLDKEKTNNGSAYVKSGKAEADNDRNGKHGDPGDKTQARPFAGVGQGNSGYGMHAGLENPAINEADANSQYQAGGVGLQRWAESPDKQTNRHKKHGSTENTAHQNV